MYDTFLDKIRYRRQFEKCMLGKLNGLSTSTVPFLFLKYEDGSCEVLITNQKEGRDAKRSE